MTRSLILLTGLFFFLLSGELLAADSLNLVWLLIDQVSLEEVESAHTPNIDYLLKRGAFGLVNVRTAGHLQPESTYLSLGTGKRSQGSKISHLGMKINGGAVNKRIAELKELNKNNYFQPQPGLLGQLSRENGIRIGVLGNSDTLNGERRTVVSLAMDEQGFVPWAEIGTELLKKTEQPEAPWGYLTNWEVLQERFLDYQGKVQALLIESGDTARIEEYATWLNQEQRNEEKLQALARIDQFIGFLLATIDLNQTQLALIVPTPSTAMKRQGKRLGWVLTVGKGSESGMLSSPATRRRGIISSSDLLPAFLQANGVKDRQSLLVLEGRLSWPELINFYDRISFIYRQRSPFIKGFILIQVIVLLLAMSTMLYNKLNKIIIIPLLIEYLLLSLFLIPFNYLLVSNLPTLSLTTVMITLFLLTILELLLIQLYLPDRLTRILVLTWSLAILLIFDLLRDQQLMADSLLGFSSIIGARYYGLGNEYMGLLIGSGLTALYGSLELIYKKSPAYLRFGEYLLLIFLALLIYCIGASNLGANFGGMITALFSAGLSYLYLKKGKFKSRVFGLGLLSLLLVLYLDYMEILGPRSHIGQAIAELFAGDRLELVNIVYRKLSINLKLLKWTIWTRVLLAFMVYLIILFKYPLPRLKKFFANYPYLTAGFYGGILGSIAAMLVNDSGVVAAATLLFYPLLILLYFLNN